MKKIIVTGGAGFIGSAIVPELLKHGFDVHVIDNLTFGRIEHLDLTKIKFYKGDIRDKVEMSRIFNDVNPEFIIHLAAIHFIPYCNQNPFETCEVNIQGTKNIIDLCGDLKVKKLFFASTAAVYPIIDKSISENDPTGPLDIYGLSKLTGEHLCHNLGNSGHTKTIICRFFNAFGPNETNPHLIPEIEKQLQEGAREIKLGNLEPKRDFIHTEDMASAVVQLLLGDIESGEVFNLGRGIEYSVKQVVEAFSVCLGEQVRVIQDKERMRPSDRMHLLADNSKLIKKTGWTPRKTLEEGIATMVQSWQK